eukprot:scaffold9543_cov73-Isochrysis_galbana.AAC.1
MTFPSLRQIVPGLRMNEALPQSGSARVNGPAGRAARHRVQNRMVATCFVQVSGFGSTSGGGWVCSLIHTST